LTAAGDGGITTCISPEQKYSALSSVWNKKEENPLLGGK